MELSGRVRPASEGDLPRIVEIYNHEVVDGLATLDTEPQTVDDRRGWLSAHDPRRHPVLVAERGAEVVGWAALTAWSPRPGYARTAEVSVYVAPEARRAGVGRALLAELVARGRAGGLGVLLARITATSGPSRALHQQAGFRLAGVMRRVGEKHGRLVDVELWQLDLDGDVDRA